MDNQPSSLKMLILFPKTEGIPIAAQNYATGEIKTITFSQAKDAIIAAVFNNDYLRAIRTNTDLGFVMTVYIYDRERVITDIETKYGSLDAHPG